MKRVLKLFIVLLLIIPFYVKASTYGIENFYVNGYQEDNGDLVVEYYFLVNGSYNGYELDINYSNNSLYEFNSNASSYGESKIHNGSSVTILEVEGVDYSENFDFSNVNGDKFVRVASAKKGQYGVYTTSFTNNGVKLMMYNPSKNNKAFYVKFRIGNIAVKHNDVGELFYSIFNGYLNDSIHHLRGKFYFKGSKNLNVWVHGPLNGSLVNENNEYFTFSVDNFAVNEKIAIRALFDTDVIKNSTKNSNVLAFDKIGLYESNISEQSNYIREQNDFMIISSVGVDIAELEDTLINNVDEDYITKNIFTIRDKYININLKCNEIVDAEKKNSYINRLEILKQKINEYIVIRNDRDIEKFETEITRNNYNNCLKSVEYLPSELQEEYKVKVNNIKLKLDEIEKNSILNDIDYLVRNPRYEIYKNVESKIKKIDNKENWSYLYNLLESKLPIVKKAEYKKETFYRVFGTISIIVTIFIFYEMYKKKYKPYDVSFNEKYYRDIPSELPCEVVSYLMYNKLTNKAVSAAMLDLIRKKKISYEKISKKNYKIKKITEEGLSLEEKKLMNVIFMNQKEITTEELKKRAKKSYVSVITKWKMYKDEIIERVNSEKLLEYDFENLDYLRLNIKFVIIFTICFPIVVIPVLLIYGFVKLVKKVFKNSKEDNSLIFFRIGFSIMILISFYEIINLIFKFKLVHTSKILFGINLIISILFIIYSFLKIRKTKKGELEYRKWLGLKHFLDGFSSKDKEIPDVELWERYLVYATLFGNAKRVSKAMQLNIKNTDVNMGSDFISYNSIDFYKMNSVISHSIRTTEARAYQSKSSFERSFGGSGNFSSGSGGSGGFSSSSSGGGGGTGGGRF